jgi:hypothetical protein
LRPRIRLARNLRQEGVVSRDPDFKGRPVGDLMLRGRAEPMRAYEPLSPEAYADPSIATYLDAFRKLEARDRSAMPAFAALVGCATTFLAFI